MNIFLTDEYGKPKRVVENALDDTSAKARYYPKGLLGQPETYLPWAESVAIGKSFDEGVAMVFKRLEGDEEIVVHMTHELILCLADQIKRNDGG